MLAIQRNAENRLDGDDLREDAYQKFDQKLLFAEGFSLLFSVKFKSAA